VVQMYTPVEEPASDVVPILRESRVWGVLGTRGMGKSLVCTQLAYQVHLQGGTVYHEGQLNFGKIFDPEILASQKSEDLENCLLVLDEVSALLPSSRSHSTFQLLVKNNLIQSRHQGLSIIYNTQFAADVPQALVNQTDWIFHVYKKWDTKWNQNNLCEGFKKHSCNSTKRRCPNTFWHFHTPNEPMAKCVDSPRKHTIKYRAVPQLGNPYYGRPPKEVTVHCAQRLYPLYSTHHKIDATNTMLVSTDDLRQKKVFELQQQVIGLVAELANDGVAEITAIQFQQEVIDSLGEEIEVNRLGRLLGAIGVEKTNENGVNKFQFGDWARDYLE